MIKKRNFINSFEGEVITPEQQCRLWSGTTVVSPGNTQEREGRGECGSGTPASVRAHLQERKVHSQLGNNGARPQPAGCEKGLRSQKEGAWEVHGTRGSSLEKHFRRRSNNSPIPCAIFIIIILQCDFGIP